MQCIRFLLASVVLLVVLSLVSIADSDVGVTSIDNEITTIEQASFSLKITNNANQVQRYSIFSLQSGLGWNVDPYPLKDKIIELKPGASYTTTIKANVIEKEKLNPGIYFVEITIQSDLGETYTKSLKIYLSPEKPIDYLPSIKATLDIDEKIDPREPVSIKLFLENKNPLDLTGLKIRIQSDIPEFTKEVDVELPPLEKKTVEFSIMPNPTQQPKEYMLFFIFENKGEIVKVIDRKFEIITLLPEFEVNVTEEKSFLKVLRTIKVRNGGNVLNTQTVKLPLSFGEYFFTTSTGSKPAEQGRALTWEITLGPDETKTMQALTNYRLLLYLAIVALILLGFYLYIKSPISVRKMATAIKSGDGALSEIKITLEVKNLSRKAIHDISVTDTVPGIADIEKSLELGTLKPKEIKHTKNGTKVIWSLAELDAHEHRMITYKLKARLNILGTVSLPRATVQFKSKGKRSRKAYSNIFRLSS